jgi:hypothetical protein
MLLHISTNKKGIPVREGQFCINAKKLKKRHIRGTL